MTWFRVGGGGSGVPASLKSRMNAVLNKKYKTLEVDYPPNEWPDDVDLLGLLEEKTASGSIVTFADGADDVPLKSCEVALPASLDGYSSVDVVQTGKNLLSDINHMTNYFSVADNGVVSQITTGAPFAWSYASSIFKTTLPAGTYTAVEELVTDVTNSSHGVQVFNSSDVRITSVSGGLKTAGTYYSTFTLSEKTDIGIVCKLYDGTARIYIVSGSTASTYEQYVTPTTHTASLGRTIYGGSVDVVKGEGTDENGNDFTFEPVEISSRLGDNTMWSDGDMSVTYRSSGTMTPITPTLITKTITANGSYQAADDSADGYSEVVVNVPQPTPAVDLIMSLNAFVSKSGVSGTNTSTVARSFTMSAAGTLVFASGSYGFTNTGSNDGYFEIQKNGVSVVKQYCNTSTNTPITVPEISVEKNDVVDLVVGFDNAHSSCNFQFYSAMVVLSEV